MWIILNPISWSHNRHQNSGFDDFQIHCLCFAWELIQTATSYIEKGVKEFLEYREQRNSRCLEKLTWFKSIMTDTFCIRCVVLLTWLPGQQHRVMICFHCFLLPSLKSMPFQNRSHMQWILWESFCRFEILAFIEWATLYSDRV